MSSDSMPLAGWVAPVCKCGHAGPRHPINVAGKCIVEGCGCTQFRPRDEKPEQEENAA